MALKLITPPAAEPLTVADMAAHLRCDLTDQALYIEALIKAAREAAENETARALITQTWDLTLDAFPVVSNRNPRAGISLPLPPLVSITSITYIDTAGITQTCVPSTYLCESSTDSAIIVPSYGQSWPATRNQLGAVTVRFACGYGNAAAVPEAIRLWMKFAVQEAYEGTPMTEFIRKMIYDYRPVSV